MKVGFFLVLRDNLEHYLHAAALVRDVLRHMPGVEIVQFSDTNTPVVPCVTTVNRRDHGSMPLLEQRWLHYSGCVGEWLLVDTDIAIRNDVQGVFSDRHFDVGVCDRNWPHDQQTRWMWQTMPFNTGVIFSRAGDFLADVLDVWRAYPDATRAEWMSEQRAVYDVVKTGRYRVKILPGQHYNYPPKTQDDAPPYAAMLHYKGERKAWRSQAAYRELAR
jgi:hypothetical protein